MKDLKHITTPFELKTDQSGDVVAVFSTFGVIDKDMDIVLPSAVKNGQQIPMTWSHDWARPVGRGVVRVDETQAIFDGKFFMETQSGVEAYKTVLAMGDLQQWSWGFMVTDAMYEQRDGDFVRVITKAEIFEVSPVLVGAGENTFTMSIKSGGAYTEHAEALVAEVQAFIHRTKGRHEYRAKVGRTLSQANRDRLAMLREALRSVQDDLEALLTETEPDKEKGQTLDMGLALRLRARALNAAMNLQ